MRAARSLAPIVTLGLAIAAPSSMVNEHGPTLAVTENVNISRLPGNQMESTVAINPAAPNQVAVVSNVERGFGLTHGWSTDGGASWSVDVIADGDGMVLACCDPSLAADEFGNVFLTYLSISLRIVVALSTDGGATFHPLAVLGSAGRAGPFPPSGAGPRSGRLPYGDQPSVSVGMNSVWVVYATPEEVVQATGAEVTELGQIGPFSTPQSAERFDHGGYGEVAIGPEGQMLIAYQNPTIGEGPTTIYTDLDPDGLGPAGFLPARAVAVTNVGGFDYIPAQAARSVDAEPGLAWDRSAGPHRGRVYLMYTTEFPDEADDLDVRVRHSDDDGFTWTPPLRVNDDPATNSQFNPRIAIDRTTGYVAVSWYDCRNDLGAGGPGDTNGIPNDDAVIYAAVSRTGGVAFTRNVRVAAAASNSMDANSFLDFGDYEGLDFHAGSLYAVWADNSNSTHDNPDGTLHQLDLYTALVRVRAT